MSVMASVKQLMGAAAETELLRTSKVAVEGKPS